MIDFVKEKIDDNIQSYGFKTTKSFNKELNTEIKSINFNEVKSMAKVKKEFNDKIELYYKEKDIEIKIKKTQDAINKRKVKSYDNFEMPNNLKIKVDNQNKPKPTRKLTF